MTGKCSDTARTHITAYAADYLGKQTVEDIAIMREALGGKPVKGKLKGHAALFWDLTTKAHDFCESDQRYIVRTEIVRILDRLEAKAPKKEVEEPKKTPADKPASNKPKTSKSKDATPAEKPVPKKPKETTETEEQIEAKE